MQNSIWIPKVLRDGKITTVHSEDPVIGDVVLPETEDAVPADGRLIEKASLKIEETALTSKSVLSSGSLHKSVALYSKTAENTSADLD